MIKNLDRVNDLIASGHIRLMMTRSELFDCLGAPDEEGGISRKYKMPSIFKYGDVQFVFPQAITPVESDSQGLLYVYVDDSTAGVEEPIYLLR